MTESDQSMPAIEKPLIHREGAAFIVEWETSGVRAIARNVREHSDALTAEVSWEVYHGAKYSILYRSMFNLHAGTTRTSLAKDLNSRAGFPFNWRTALDQLAILVPNMWRAGTPPVWIADVTTEAAPTFLIDRLLPENDVSVWYGNGEAGKSLLLMGCAVAVASGQPLAGTWGVRNPGPVLYLDWETNENDQSRRFKRLSHGFPVPAGFERLPIMYRRMRGSLAADFETVQELVDREGFRLICGDSLGFAVGDDLDIAAGAIRVMDAARGFNATFLFSAHITKEATRGQSKGQAASIFGSKFFELSARMTWEVRAGTAEEDDVKTIAMINRKSNNVRHQEPVAFRVEFGQDYGPIAILDVAIADSPKGPASLPHRVTLLLKTGAKTIPEIMTATGGGEDSIRTVLRRMADKGDARQITGTRPARWGLSAPEFAGVQESYMDPADDSGGPIDGPGIAPSEAEAVDPAVAVAEPEAAPEVYGPAALQCAICGLVGSLDDPTREIRYTAHGLPVCPVHAKDYEDD